MFYRFVYALDPRDESVRWVYVHDADVVGAAAQPHGVAIADETGHFAFLGAGSGEVMWKTQPGPRTSVARLPGDGGLVDHSGNPADPNALPARALSRCASIARS